MNMHDHIITYNADEARPVSEWIDRHEAHKRDLALLRVIGILATLFVFGMLMTYTVYGWAAS